MFRADKKRTLRNLLSRSGRRSDTLRGVSILAAAAAAGALARPLVRRARRLDLRGRGVVVTGGSRGLGLLLAHDFGRRGARVAICGRDEHAVERARVELASHGVEVLARPCDLGNREEAIAFIEEAARAFGRIDVLVNNAGVIQVAPLDGIGHEEMEDAMRANFWSAVNATFAALPYLREQGRAARLVNIVSIGGRVAVPHLLPYDASKFALMGLAEGLQAELAWGPGSLRVTNVIPAPMRTGSFYNAEFGGDARREFGWFSVASSLPLASIDARRAARRIVAAAQDGRPEVRIGIGALVLDRLHGFAPVLTTRLMGLLAAVLPKAPEPPAAMRKGRDISTSLPGSLPLRLGDRAALANNEAPPRPIG